MAVNNISFVDCDMFCRQPGPANLSCVLVTILPVLGSSLSFVLVTIPSALGSSLLFVLVTIPPALGSSLWPCRGAPLQGLLPVWVPVVEPSIEWEVCGKCFPSSPQCRLSKYTCPWGQAHSDGLEHHHKDTYFGIPVIYSGQWKISMHIKLIFKN